MGLGPRLKGPAKGLASTIHRARIRSTIAIATSMAKQTPASQSLDDARVGHCVEDANWGAGYEGAEGYWKRALARKRTVYLLISHRAKHWTAFHVAQTILISHTPMACPMDLRMRMATEASRYGARFITHADRLRGHLGFSGTFAGSSSSQLDPV